LFKEKKVEVPPPAPKPVPVAPAPEPVYQKIELKAAALFDTNESIIKQAGKEELDDLAEKLRGFASVEKIQLLGHTDSRGSKRYNRDLSQRRADAVKSYLVGKGIDANVIEAIGVGEDVPIADNTTAEGRAKNRRVEVGIKATHRVK
jgi:OOP family OmpA-OmpF porin